MRHHLFDNTERILILPPVRHCACVYYQDWHRNKPPRPGNEGSILPAVARQVYQQRAIDGTLGVTHESRPGSALSPTTGVIVAVNDEVPRTPLPTQTSMPVQTGLPFDEEAKLVYGVVLSLRNMIKKLSGR